MNTETTQLEQRILLLENRLEEFEQKTNDGFMNVFKMISEIYETLIRYIVTKC